MSRLALHWWILIAVVVAAFLGLSLNATVSTRESDTNLGELRKASISDSVDRIEIVLYKKANKQQPWVEDEKWIVDPTGAEKGKQVVLSLSELEKKSPTAYRIFYQNGRSWARWIGDIGYSIGNLFLRMLKMVAVPLIITSLMTGVLGLADAGRLRKLFGMTITYYVVTSMLAIFLGLLLVNIIRPGVNSTEMQARSEAMDVGDDLGSTLFNQVKMLIPENPFEAVVQSNFLSIIAFTLAFGVFTILAGGMTLQFFKDFFQSAFDVMMKMTMAIIYLAPIGVFFLMLYATSTQGIMVFRSLAWYLLTVALALLIHATITLPCIVYFVGRRNPLAFANAMSPALLTAFSSASSNATLPLTMSCVENRANIDNRVGSFVLPLGATVNMDGTALFEVVAVLFIAQLEGGLSIGQQVIVAFTALLASIGAAGIPSAGLVMMVIVLQAVGLPTDRVALILAVDRILDMCRTSVNVWSDACGCAVIARFDQGENPTDPLLPSNIQEDSKIPI